MDLDNTIDLSNISEPPPLLLPEPAQFSQMLSNEKPVKKMQANSTTVYYYLNDEEVPFKIEVAVNPSKLTLAHLKCTLNKQNFKCYVTQMDQFLKREVKAEITDDYTILKPNSNGIFEFYLLSNEQPSVDLKNSGTLRATARKKQRFVPTTNRPVTNPFQKPISAAFLPMNRRQQSASIYHNLEMHHKKHRRQPYRATMSDESTKLDDDESSFMPTNKYSMRNYASDSETSADFTSVSEMENKYRQRKHGMGRMRRRTRSYSGLSTTCDDTDISVRVDLITVELNLNTSRVFGLNVIARKTANYHGIYVGDIQPNSVVALDGRIKTNQLILEVNGFPLDSCTCEDAIATLQNEVCAAAARRGTITLTLSESPKSKQSNDFHLPDESVRPLDTECWRDTVNLYFSLNPTNQNSKFSALPQIPPNPNANRNWPSSGVGSSISSAMSVNGGKQFSVNMPMDIIVNALADPCTGLKRRNHTQLNLTISESFSGQDLINWLADNVVGLEDRKSCEKYSGELLRNGFIEQKFNRNSFTAQCYYTINESKIRSMGQLSQMNTMKRGVLTPIDITNRPMLDDTAVLEQAHKCGKFCKLKRFMCLHQRKINPNTAKKA